MTDQDFKQQMLKRLNQQGRQLLNSSGAMLGKLANASNVSDSDPIDLTQKPNKDPMSAFRRQMPDLAKQILGVRFAKASQFVGKMLPNGAMETATDHLFDRLAQAAEFLSQPSEIWQEANVADQQALRDLSPEQIDELVTTVINRNLALAAVEGGVTGLAGVAGALVDFPLVLLVALRTIYQISQCYGVDLSGSQGRELVYRVMAASNLDLLTEKQALMLSISTVGQLVASSDVNALQKMVGSATSADYFRKLAGDLSQSFNINIQPSLLMRVLPVATSATSALYNARIISTVAKKAQQAFSDVDQPARQQQDILSHVDTPSEQSAGQSAKDQPAEQRDQAPTTASKPTDAHTSKTEEDQVASKPTHIDASTGGEIHAADVIEVPAELAASAKSTRKRTVRARKPVDGDIEPANKTQH